MIGSDKGAATRVEPGLGGDHSMLHAGRFIAHGHAEQIAESQHPTARIGRGAGREIEKWKRSMRVDLDHGELHRRVATHELAFELAAIVEGDAQVVGIEHIAPDREHMAFGRHQEAALIGLEPGDSTRAVDFDHLRLRHGNGGGKRRAALDRQAVVRRGAGAALACDTIAAIANGHAKDQYLTRFDRLKCIISDRPTPSLKCAIQSLSDCLPRNAPRARRPFHPRSARAERRPACRPVSRSGRSTRTVAHQIYDTLRRHSAPRIGWAIAGPDVLDNPENTLRTGPIVRRETFRGPRAGPSRDRTRNGSRPL